MNKNIHNVLIDFYKKIFSEKHPEFENYKDVIKLSNKIDSEIRRYSGEGKDNIGSPLNLPLNITYFAFYILLFLISPFFLFNHEDIIVLIINVFVVNLIIFPIYCIFILFFLDYSIRALIINIILTIKLKKEYISYQLLKNLLKYNHHFDYYMNNILPLSIKVKTIEIDNIIINNSSSKEEEDDLMYLKNFYIKNKETISLLEFNKAVSYILNERNIRFSQIYN